jgi:hypothetical protein
MKMMRKYKAVPDWWYGVLLIVMNAFSFATCLAWPTNLSWWALIIALLISFVWTIPIGIVYATINIHLGLNVFTEYIIGYMQPGRPLAMMLFKTYGYITIASHEPGPFLPARPEAWPLSQGTATRNLLRTSSWYALELRCPARNHGMGP